MAEIRQAEVKYGQELEALERADDAPRPPGWRLSPKAVEAYVMGRDRPVGGCALVPSPVYRAMEISAAEWEEDGGRRSRKGAWSRH